MWLPDGMRPLTALAALALGAVLAIPTATPSLAGVKPVGSTISPPLAAAGPPPSGIRATGAELAVAGTGQQLWGRAAGTERPMGSITKIMTALLVLQAGNLDRKITIPQAAVTYVNDHGASSAGLRPGDVLTARQLLDALLLPSGCDAAYVLATAYGPGRTTFIAHMNATASKMGLAHTHFSNFDGLPWPSGTSTYSTPQDLIKLARAAMGRATFRTIVAQRSYHLAAAAHRHAYTWDTTNLLLGSYTGADGVKTGFTSAAGYCLLFEAKDGTRTLIGVVLHSTATNPDARFTDATTLLNWGFGRKTPAPPVTHTHPAARTPLGAAYRSTTPPPKPGS
jgi:serine-type D-Ala-D-Ala carboxypeptidase (penicillin-binding protein 5/6)